MRIEEFAVGLIAVFIMVNLAMLTLMLTMQR